MWVLLAFGSALFAGLTAILAKVGIRDTDADVATAMRTVVVLLLSWLMAWLTGSLNGLGTVSTRTWVFLILSGLATGASWLCYFRALQLGDVNKVTPIDKSSTVLTMALAFVLLGESLTALKLLCMVLIGAGAYLMIQHKPAQAAAGGAPLPANVGADGSTEAVGTDGSTEAVGTDVATPGTPGSVPVAMPTLAGIGVDVAANGIGENVSAKGIGKNVSTKGLDADVAMEVIGADVATHGTPGSVPAAAPGSPPTSAPTPAHRAKSPAWLLFALGSAVFASLTAILGKIGIEGVDATLGTAIRTCVVLAMAWAIVLGRGKAAQVRRIRRGSLVFLLLSGLATGASWLCYYSALRLGPASVVVPIDKLSILVSVGFARVVFGERLTLRAGAGLALLVAGTLLLLL